MLTQLLQNNDRPLILIKNSYALYGYVLNRFNSTTLKYHGICLLQKRPKSFGKPNLLFEIWKSINFETGPLVLDKTENTVCSYPMQSNILTSILPEP